MEFTTPHHLIAQLEAHPLALLFPPLSEKDMRKLEEDIAANGQLFAAVLYEEKILDGLHRAKGCHAKSLDLKCIRFEDCGFKGTAADFVLSANNKRRHVDDKTRALIEVSVSQYKRPKGGRPRKNLSPNRAQVLSKQPKRAPQTRVKIAREKGISKREAQQVIDIVKRAPELVPQVAQGRVTFDEAATIAAPEKPRKQAKATTFNAARHGTKAAAAINKWIRRCPSEHRDEFKAQILREGNFTADRPAAQLLAELKRKRKEINAPRPKGFWNPDDIAKYELVLLLDWVEDELCKIPG